MVENSDMASGCRLSVGIDYLAPVGILARRQHGDLALASGEIRVALRRVDGTPDGTVFMPHAYREVAANLRTNAALDPVGKIPEFKYCVVSLTSTREAGGLIS